MLTAFTFSQVPLLPFLTCRYFGSEGAFIHSHLLRACRGTIHKFINPGRTIVPLSSSHRTTELHVPYHTVRFLIVTWIGIRFSNQSAGLPYHTDCSHLFCSRFAAHSSPVKRQDNSLALPVQQKSCNYWSFAGLSWTKIILLYFDLQVVKYLQLQKIFTSPTSYSQRDIPKMYQKCNTKCFRTAMKISKLIQLDWWIKP